MTSSQAEPVVLITGAARRIGAQIARHLHARGSRVLLHFHNSQDDAVALMEELEAQRRDSVGLLQADLAEVDTFADLVDAALARFGRLDGLVNNASLFYSTPLGAATPAQWDALMAVNAKAPFFLAQAVAPALRKSRGAIVNLTDIYVERPRADLAPYVAAKAALAATTRALALALAPDVRVNAVAPGAILWPESAGGGGEAGERLIARTPLHRTGSPDEIAATVGWLLYYASYVTGQVIAVDGGRGISP